MCLYLLQASQLSVAFGKLSSETIICEKSIHLKSLFVLHFTAFGALENGNYGLAIFLASAGFVAPVSQLSELRRCVHVLPPFYSQQHGKTLTPGIFQALSSGK
jgi:hypothetical protein